jgi:hypothetical protein
MDEQRPPSGAVIERPDGADGTDGAAGRFFDMRKVFKN